MTHPHPPRTVHTPYRLHLRHHPHVAHHQRGARMRHDVTSSRIGPARCDIAPVRRSLAETASIAFRGYTHGPCRPVGCGPPHPTDGGKGPFIPQRQLLPKSQSTQPLLPSQRHRRPGPLDHDDVALTWLEARRGDIVVVRRREVTRPGDHAPRGIDARRDRVGRAGLRVRRRDGRGPMHGSGPGPARCDARWRAGVGAVPRRCCSGCAGRRGSRR